MTVRTNRKNDDRRTLADFPKGTKVFCFQVYHPDHGWCGGEDDDRWTDNRAVIEANVKHCRYDYRFVETVIGSGKKTVSRIYSRPEES